MDLSELKIVEVKGDVTFYEDAGGKLYQTIRTNERSAPIPVKDGKVEYMFVQAVNKHVIKYELNGTCGYSVWKSGKVLDDRFWSFEDAKSYAEGN